MISKAYYIEILIRVIMIVAFALLFAYLWNGGQMYLTIICFLLILLQGFLLVRFLNTTNRKIAYFFESISNDDFTISFLEEKGPNSLKELHRSLNKVKNLIKETQIRNKEQESYYQEILKQVKIGILTMNRKGHILFVNPTAKRLLNMPQLNHLNQLERVDEKLFNLLSTLEPFERKLFQLTNERETRSLVLKTTTTILNDEKLNLITIQDINNELSEKETDSWMKLIRVLTHEIMNSITPISSISDSILKYYKSKNGEIEADLISDFHIKNTIKGLEIIKEQGNSLVDFVNSYRSMLSIPVPDKKLVSVQKLIDEIKVLTSQEKESKAITFNTKHLSGDFDIFADKKQISQTLINLIKNAIQSIEGKEDGGVVELISGIDDNGKFIKVKDNGVGIPSDMLEQIFVPFFTTKLNGSGIGLSLSRQIMQMHNGNLTVNSIPNKGTSFTLIF